MSAALDVQCLKRIKEQLEIEILTCKLNSSSSEDIVHVRDSPRRG